MEEAVLPYREEDLERKDAIGGRAKREAVAYWSKHVRHCTRHLSFAEQDAKHYEKSVNDEEKRRLHAAAMNRVTSWKYELNHAKERVHNLTKMCMEAWK